MNLTEVKKKIFRNSNAKIAITSTYGPRTYMYNGKKISDFHNGIDYATYGRNLSLYPIDDGYVIQTGYDNISGNYIFIRYVKLGIVSFYCHLKDKPLVKTGDRVKTNEKVGYVGSTGQSTGEHLHLGIKYVEDYYKKKYSGWINPAEVKLKEIYQTECRLKLRSLPNKIEKCEILLQIPKEAKINMIIKNYTKDYDKVEYNGVKGYVLNKYIN